METVKVSSKGQVVIPKALRESHHIETGMELIVTAVGGELRLKPVRAGGGATLSEVAGMLHKKGRVRMTEAEEKTAMAKMLAARDEATKR